MAAYTEGVVRSAPSFKKAAFRERQLLLPSGTEYPPLIPGLRYSPIHSTVFTKGTSGTGMQREQAVLGGLGKGARQRGSRWRGPRGEPRAREARETAWRAARAK